MRNYKLISDWNNLNQFLKKKFLGYGYFV